MSHAGTILGKDLPSRQAWPLPIARNPSSGAAASPCHNQFALAALPTFVDRATFPHRHADRLRPSTFPLKRLMDIALGSAAIFVILPLLCAIGIAIRIDSPGPVLYRSARVGRKGVVFACYKFRTMGIDADATKEKLRSRNERDGAFFKISDDPRVTRLGRWLRRYSLDELPQLWNVLRGEMSLVGPRPHPIDDVERYQIQDFRRLAFTPGITGLWQITARRDPSFQRCVALDVEYINRWNLRLDFEILARTLPAVLRGSGQ